MKASDHRREVCCDYEEHAGSTVLKEFAFEHFIYYDIYL